MTASPSTDNYHIGKGVLSFKATGAGAYRDLGNAPSFVYTPDIQTKDHFSSRLGVKTKDLTRITQVGAKLKITLEEITPDNLAMFVLGEVETNTDGSFSIAGLSKTSFTGSLKLVGTNDVGQQVDFVGDVSFVPSGDFRFITDSDDYSQLELTADVLVDVNGHYGVFTVRPQD